MSQDLTLKIDFSAPVTLASCACALRSFVVWWWEQVSALLPDVWQEKLRAMASRPRLIVLESGWRIENLDCEPVILNALAPSYELKDELSRKASYALTQSIDVVLPRSEGLFKRIVLPAVAASRLKDVVRLQIDRLSPFRGDDVQFDCSIVPIEVAPAGSAQVRSNEILVEVAIVPKRRLFAVEEALRAAGLVPRTFSFAGTTVVLPPRGLPWTKQTQHRAIITATGLALVTAAVLLSPVTRIAEIADLRSEIGALAPRVERAQADQQELTRYQLPAQAVSPDRAAALDVVLDLTKRFPDTVSVSGLEIAGSLLRLEGSAPAAVDVRGLIARSPLFSAVHSEHTSSDNRFFLTAMLKPGES